MGPDSVEKCHSVRATRVVPDCEMRRGKNGDMVVHQVMNQMEGNQLRSHVLGFEILLLFMGEVFVAQFAKSPKD
jgi:hypothetical protein